MKTNLFWDFRWDQNYLGAGSNYYQNQFTIMLYGGHIRAEGSDFDLIAFTLCHELGHYLGGNPKQRIHNLNGDWSSAEGQSDWFAAKVCLPQLYSYFKTNFPHRLNSKWHPLAIKQCENNQETDKCAWILNIAQNFAGFSHYYFQREEVKADLSANAREIVPTTLYNIYPSTQCRLDTIRSAALCATKLNSTILGQQQCLRPRCWFNGD